MENTTSTDGQSGLLEAKTGTASPKHRKLQNLVIGYLFENDPDVIDARKEYPVSEKLPADVYVVRKDGTREVVEVEPNIEPYIRIEVATQNYEDACGKLIELEEEGLANEGFLGEAKMKVKAGRYSHPGHFHFVPKGDMHEARRKLESRGWKAETSCRTNKLVRKFRNMGDGAERFSILVPYNDEASLDTFVRETGRYGLPVFRVYLSSEDGDGIVGFRELGGNKTCQK